MGDRGNICVRAGDERSVYLYTHWGGYDLPLKLRDALARKLRWADGAYLTRIIFDEMTKGQVGTATGFGISTTICDNEYSILVVDVPSQKVLVVSEDAARSFDFDTPIRSASFEEFCAMSSEEARDFHQLP